ncbi:hypothetical protein [Xylophilus sp. Leaf220]|uniref:hypothetical protein n=1 Tax=Xylophilus sp. Leaf220 TaxID=1735686 RepID=UPI0006FBEFE9|nr:hypothetical protein [Xylophilus sp. Leaf220]KQM68467.1 hypothetical protein ASE76_14355 [Xylophilus sp. Leaf220]
MAVTSFSNQTSTLQAIASMTDFVVTEPMKRYFVGLDYAAISDADKLVIPTTNGFYNKPITVAAQNRACSKYEQNVSAFLGYDRTGRSYAPDQGAFIGGVPRPGWTALCGSTSVYAINSGPPVSVLKSNAAHLLYPFTSFQEGWLRFNTPGAGAGLPIIGFSVSSAVGDASNGISTNYGWTVKHKGTPFER